VGGRGESGWFSGIALGYGLDDRGLVFRQGLGIFSSPRRLDQSPVQWVPGTLFLGVKRPVRQADHSLPSSAEVKNA
jgi:hypothetical protein